MGLPVEVNNLMLGSLGGYTVGRSLRFRSSASAYLNRTPASASNRTTWTWSGWVKRGTLGASQYGIFSAGTNNSNHTSFYFTSDAIGYQSYSGGVAQWNVATNAVYRDPSAWYHLVVVTDTSNATSSNRILIYINGVSQSFSTASYPTSGTQGFVNQNNEHDLARLVYASGYSDLYLAEVNFIDGQALTPSSFGAYDTNGVWQPKKYSGTYGTNGFYLPFSNTTSTTTLVQDSSGNGNNWTPNNISLTAGTTYDSMIDSPTNAAGNSNGIGNYAVLNPLRAGASFINNGNLSITNINNGSITFYGSMYSTNWYAELTVDSLTGGGLTYIGVALENNTDYSYVSDGTKQSTSGGNQAYSGTGYTTGDVIGIAYSSSGTITFYKNNVSQGAAFTGLSGNGTFMLGSGSATARTYSVNFGQRPFTYTPPSGYKALNTYNLPAPSIANGAQYMAATLYTGNGGTQSISNAVNGVSFQPDFVWIKNRAAAVNHQLQNSNAGWQYGLNSNTTSAEFTDANAITGSTSSGWSMNNNYNSHNQSGVSYVGWNWKAGGTGVTNNSGTITSTVSVSAQSGFSVVTYTGNGTAGSTVGHSLGVAPNLVIWKKRSSTGNWFVWSKAADVAAGSTRWGYLNATNAFSTSASTNEYPTYKVDPTSTVFTVNGTGSSNGTNDSSATYVAYCFSAVSGYSAMGSWTGNGSSDGPFVFTNFRPRYVMWKRIDVSGDGWWIVDSSRDTYNVATQLLFAQSSTSETAITTPIDFLSNGFKLRNGADGSINGSGGTYIYMAFAENPFSIARAR